jgi:hypothetical protein
MIKRQGIPSHTFKNRFQHALGIRPTFLGVDVFLDQSDELKHRLDLDALHRRISTTAAMNGPSTTKNVIANSKRFLLAFMEESSTVLLVHSEETFLFFMMAHERNDALKRQSRCDIRCMGCIGCATHSARIAAMRDQCGS